MIQEYSKALMIVLAVVFAILPIIAVGLRIWAKMLSRKALRIDDWLSVGALIICVSCCITQIFATTEGRLGQHQNLLFDGSTDSQDPGFIAYEKAKFAINILTIVGLGAVKASILFFYVEIFSVRSFRIATYVMLGVTAVWTVSFFFTNLFVCYPITPLVDLFLGRPGCMDALSMWLTSVITNVILDFVILLMPIPMVMRLHMPLKQRIGLVGIFLLGMSVCAASITRTYTFFYIAFQFTEISDLTYYTSPIFFWSVIEQSLAIVAGCLPTLRPVWLRLRGRKTTPTTTNSKYSHGSDFPANKSSSNRSKYDYELETNPVSGRFERLGSAPNTAAPAHGSSMDGLVLPHTEVTTNIGVGDLEAGNGRGKKDAGIMVERTLETNYASRNHGY